MGRFIQGVATPTLALLVVTVALSACGGGGSSVTANLPPAEDFSGQDLVQPEQQPQSAFNGGLRGRIIGTDRFNDYAPVRIDLATLQRSSLLLTAVQDMVLTTQSFGLASNFSLLTPSSYSSDATYLQVFPLCNDRSVSFYDDGCFGTFDSQLRSQGSGVLRSVEVIDSPKLSRSGNRFVTVEYSPLDQDKSYITVFNAQTGATEQLLSLPIDKTFGVDRSGAPAVAWGLNDELIYSNPATNPPRIFITEPGGADVVRRINLPQRYSGIITDLQLSPDGKKLLIEYERYGYTDGSFPIVLDLDTLALSRPAVTETDVDILPLGDSQSGSVMDIRGWSEDSRWIFVAYKNFNGTPTVGETINSENQVVSFFVSGAWHVSAVPATANAAVLSPDRSIATQGVISPLSYIDDRGAVKAIWGEDYSPVGVR